MSNSEFGWELQQTKLPDTFYSSTHQQPISQCLVCEKSLLEEGTQYFIEKSVRKYPEYQAEDIVFEYAMCLSCAEKQRKELSTESLQKIEEFFSERVDFQSRSQEFLEKSGTEVAPWLARCVITNKPLEELEEYTLHAHCQGGNLLFTFMPYMISGEAMDEIADLLSEQTLGEIDRFTGKYFTGPPEVSEILKKRRLILL
ncbi:hypothetical protein AAG747_09685 [Rapidithrix thailandica]|uniref:Uncharacterized protein n=1 Tax=Rapidithrix thailandica TaxID=413964 RepID=A0AAW9S8V0_9BACT